MDDNPALDSSPDSTSVRDSRDFASSKSDGLIKFRNYQPQTDFLEGLYIFEKADPKSVHEFIKDKLDLISDTSFRIDPKLMEPKKVDWDLKRRIEKRLDILEKETRKDISTHIRNTRKKR